MRLDDLEKKNGKKIWTLLLIITVILTFSPWSISQIKIGPQEKILQTNDEAPWNGVLVPHERYMYYKQELDVCRYKDQNPVPCEAEEKQIWPWFVTALFLGYIGGIAH